jgi:hypothetical protein
VQTVIVGSGSPLPDPLRAGPATLVRTSSGDMLFDSGRGVLMRAAAAGFGRLRLPRAVPNPPPIATTSPTSTTSSPLGG